ncbi:MAG: hypothetical protein HYV07_16760, partial [Deltaproteobacteria bacterium]|nr:hypothetical protein [Deltaproteobacteria bacterium]
AAEARVLPLRVPFVRGPSGATGATGLASAPALVGWRRTSQCHWCRAADRHADIVADLHRDHVERGLGALTLSRIAGARLETRGVAPPSARALSRHLSQHLDREALARELGVAALETPEADVPPMGGQSAPREWSELWRLHAVLERRLTQLDGALGTLGDAGHLDVSRFGQLTGLANATRQVLESISKLRSEPPMVAAVAQTAVRAALSGYSAVVANHLVELADDAEESGASELAARVRELGPALVEEVVEVGREAVAATLATFAIERPSVSVT